jgi:beta-glucosidase
MGSVPEDPFHTTKIISRIATDSDIVYAGQPINDVTINIADSNIACMWKVDGDLNNDCQVNLTDLAILCENWLTWAYIYGENSALTSISRLSEQTWADHHQQVLTTVAGGAKFDLIFIGDSITQGWGTTDAKLAIWNEFYGNRNATYMHGFSGDRTQNVIWRIQNGEFNGLNPKLAVLLIGTNNSNGTENTAEEIGQGIIAITKMVRQKLPNTKVLMLAIFPRGQWPSLQREKNAAASLYASSIADNHWIYYLDIGNAFLTPDGELPIELFSDYLHPSPAGARIWAEQMEPMIKQLLGE